MCFVLFLLTQINFYYTINLSTPEVKGEDENDIDLFVLILYQVLIFAVLVTLNFYYIFWAVNCVSGFVNYQQKMISLYEILFHQDEVSESAEGVPESTNILQNYRIDPTVPENLKSWLSLRIAYIEDKKQASRLEISIQQLNRAILVCVCVISWLVYKYIYKGVLNEYGPNATTYMMACFIINILVPVIYSLNNAVNTVSLVENDCLSKLALL
jgi:hypothetical protein